jgi:hypothetical protein
MIGAQTIVCFVENFEPQAVETRHTAVGSHPNKALPIFEDTVDLPVRQTILDAEMAGNGQVALGLNLRQKATKNAE